MQPEQRIVSVVTTGVTGMTENRPIPKTGISPPDAREGRAIAEIVDPGWIPSAEDVAWAASTVPTLIYCAIPSGSSPPARPRATGTEITALPGAAGSSITRETTAMIHPAVPTQCAPTACPTAPTAIGLPSETERKQTLAFVASWHDEPAWMVPADEAVERALPVLIEQAAAIELSNPVEVLSALMTWAERRGMALPIGPALDFDVEILASWPRDLFHLAYRRCWKTSPTGGCRRLLISNVRLPTSWPSGRPTSRGSRRCG